MDTLINKYDDFAVWRIAQTNLLESLRFVLQTNCTQHSFNLTEDEFNETLNGIYLYENRHFEDSIFFKLTDDAGIIGTLRITKWNSINPYPLPEYLCENKLININDIWHVGRFAMKNNVSSLRKRTVLKIALVHALEYICEHKSNILIAECDVRLIATLQCLSLGVKEIGDRRFLLGSLTAEIMASYNDVYPFYLENRGLIECPNEQSKDRNKCKQQYLSLPYSGIVK